MLPALIAITNLSLGEMPPELELLELDELLDELLEEELLELDELLELVELLELDELLELEELLEDDVPVPVQPARAEVIKAVKTTALRRGV